MVETLAGQVFWHGEDGCLRPKEGRSCWNKENCARLINCPLIAHRRQASSHVSHTANIVLGKDYFSALKSGRLFFRKQTLENQT